MMETIASWIAEIIGQLINLVVSFFLNLMNLDLGTIVGFFPALVTGYQMFQSIGVGLIICIAVFQTTKFFLGSIVEAQDTPIRILLRAFIAGMLLWFGGYLIELVVDIAAIPYKEFIEMDAAGDITIGIPMDEFTVEALFIDASAAAFSASTILVLYVIVMLVIGWNLMKLMIEVLERYLLVAVLAFSAPLAYSTITSQSTSTIFRSWLNMLLGQCALMTISAWMLKLCISGFSFSPDAQGTAFRLLLTLALCKIAQRADTYLQTLGIGVATTGGNLMDEAIAGFMAIGNAAGFNPRTAGVAGDRASKDSILGENPAPAGLGEKFRNKAREWARPQPFGTLGGLASVAAEVGGIGVAKSEHPQKFAPLDRMTGKNLMKAYKAGYEEAPQNAIALGKDVAEKIANSKPAEYGKRIASGLADKVDEGIENAAAFGKDLKDKADQNETIGHIKDMAGNLGDEIEKEMNTQMANANATKEMVAEDVDQFMDKHFPAKEAGADQPGPDASTPPTNIDQETASDTSGATAFGGAETEGPVQPPAGEAAETASNIEHSANETQQQATAEPNAGGNNAFEHDPQNPNNVRPSAEAAEKGIKFEDGQIKGNNTQSTGSYLSENFSTLGNNAQTASMAANTMSSNSAVAENVLNNTDASAMGSASEETAANINKMGGAAVDSAFEGGLDRVTAGDGNVANGVQNFQSKTIPDGTRQVSFTTSNEQGQPTNSYEVYSGPQRNSADHAVRTASGETWYVNKKQVETNNIPGFGDSGPTPSSQSDTQQPIDTMTTFNNSINGPQR